MALAGGARASASPQEQAPPAPTVLAHYMVALHGYEESVEGYRKDIRDAQALGIDAFVLNTPRFKEGPNFYAPRIELLFEAARQTGGFKLMFSVDMCCNTSAETIRLLMRTYAGHPSYLHYEGRPMLSTFIGADRGKQFWQAEVLEPLRREGINVFFVPHFVPKDSITYESLRREYEGWWKDVVDGLFNFGAAGTPAEIIAWNDAYARLMREAGKPFMAGYSPEYWGIKQKDLGRRYFEYQGGIGIEQQWRAIIDRQRPQWVQIVTWNDFGEATYISPVAPVIAMQQSGVRSQGVPMRDHAGHAQLMAFYVAWYKAGAQPRVVYEGLFAFYRTHRKDIQAAGDTPVSRRLGDVRDTITLTTILATPATLLVVTGDQIIEQPVEAGIRHVQVPFVHGQQYFELKRNGAIFAATEGEVIEEWVPAYNFIVASAYKYGSVEVSLGDLSSSAVNSESAGSRFSGWGPLDLLRAAAIPARWPVPRPDARELVVAILATAWLISRAASVAREPRGEGPR